MIRRVALLALLLGCTRNAPTTATGTIESTQSDLAVDGIARLVSIRVHEGEMVAAGDTIAVLTTITLAADLDRQQAALADAEAQYRDLRAGARPAEIARAAADLRRAEAEQALAESTRRRIEPLARNGDVAAQQGDEVRAVAAQSAARVAAARESLRLLEAGSRPEAIRAASARVDQATAALAAATARERDLVLLAPSAGRVRSAWFETGELVPAGRPIVTLADEGKPWVRVYVGQEIFARITSGMRATATLDVDGPPIVAHVVAMSDRAEFTPRVALTESERADLTFWVKLELDDTTHRAKPGLPVTVQFDIAQPPP